MTRSGDAGALCGESEIMKRRIRVVSLINELLFGGDESRLLAFSRTVNAKDFDHRVVCVKRPDRDFDSRNGTMRALYARSGIPVEINHALPVW